MRTIHNKNRKKKSVIFVGLLFLLFLISACAVDYVTGKHTFNLVSEQQEIQIGREADPSIISQYGLYDDPKLTEYVDGIGQKIAVVSQRPNLKYTFRVVDSPIVNAFALPGGWVYFTRGILAHFNSEAELAGVMGHEIGHVVARHGAEQMSKAQLAGIGLLGMSAVSPELAKFSDLAQMGVGLLFLKFGRNQESESDRLGVEYSTKLGYDANSMAKFFQTIGRLSEASGGGLPDFLSTHPNPADREKTVSRLAGDWQKKIDYKPLNISPRDYLKRIDGIVYGNDPRQGFVENNIFYHPTMRFQFPVPANWKLANLPTVVQMVSTDEKAYIQFALASTNSPDSAANKLVQDNQLTVLKRQNTKLNGFPALFLDAKLENETQSIRVITYFIEKDKSLFSFQGLTASADYEQNKNEILNTLNGFRQLTDKNALNKKPLRVRIRTVSNPGNFKSIMQQFGMKDEMIPELAILNGVEETTNYQKGDLIKIIQE
ncbi:MAG: M48 family metalloprotease [Deferribacteres bacterium]|nr:M48 family metalloprotease [Deferribacteres bacterium]